MQFQSQIRAVDTLARLNAQTAAAVQARSAPLPVNRAVRVNVPFTALLPEPGTAGAFNPNIYAAAQPAPRAYGGFSYKPRRPTQAHPPAKGRRSEVQR